MENYTADELLNIAKEKFKERIAILEKMISNKFYKGQFRVEILTKFMEEYYKFIVYFDDKHYIRVDYSMEYDTRLQYFSFIHFQSDSSRGINIMDILNDNHKIDDGLSITLRNENREIISNENIIIAGYFVYFVDNVSKFAEEYKKHLNLNYLHDMFKYTIRKFQILTKTHCLENAYTLLLINKSQKNFPLDILKIIIHKILF